MILTRRMVFVSQALGTSIHIDLIWFDLKMYGNEQRTKEKFTKNHQTIDETENEK